jgi:hypothetical protein
MAPFEYVVDAAARVVRVRYLAQPTYEQWAATMERIFAEPEYAPDFGILLDRSALPGTPETDYTARSVKYIDQRIREAGPSRWAILVGGTAAFGMGRMAQSLSTQEGAIQVFRVRAEAEAWLAGRRH